ncbi:HET-domain-containing protein [Xylariaceae sp. FL1019]|nr:HET-domain-containing protein [Xylariaceae sp. FL1019]
MTTPLHYDPWHAVIRSSFRISSIRLWDGTRELVASVRLSLTMRLMNTDTGDIEEFFGQSIPHYAILSHCWGDDEISFHEWVNRHTLPELRQRQGCQKIEAFCDLVKSEGHFCCIDKSSSQELSEAINSMFRWYQDAEICLVYLYDYDITFVDDEVLRRCKWFTRGWTLQELIAPRFVNFYNKDWQPIIDKDGFSSLISVITGIDIGYLLGSHDLETASVAKKMSWASNRETTRPEDMAYGLLGLFDINMPLMYGEGETKAFIRLQKKIMKQQPDDHSLFAWGTPVERFSNELSLEEAARLPQIVVGPRLVSPQPLLGLLASSPREFSHSGNFAPVSWSGAFYLIRRPNMQPASYPKSAGRGVEIELPVNSFRGDFLSYYQYYGLNTPQVRYGLYMILLCKDVTDSEAMLCLPCMSHAAGYLGRTMEIVKERSFPSWPQLDERTLIPFKRHYTFAPEKKPWLRGGDVVLRSLVDLRTSQSRPRFIPSRSTHSPLIEYFSYDLYLRPKKALMGRYQIVHFRDGKNSLQEWAVILGRVGVPGKADPVIRIGVSKACPYQDSPNFDVAFDAEKTFQGVSPELYCFDVNDLPLIEVRVERSQILPDDPSGWVDVVDITPKDRPGEGGGSELTERLKLCPVSDLFRF